MTRSLLSVTAVLSQLRLDGGAAGRLSPSPVVKLIGALTCILLTSLARNLAFVLVVLAAVLVRACLMPRQALLRLVTGAGAAAVLTLLLMLPAALLGQPRAALGLAAKSLACVGIALTVALCTPAAQLTGALRALGVPAVAILTLDLALRSIVRLGETAAEVLTALRLRSVGANPDKGTAMAGVGGVTLLKAARAAQDTHDALCCRGFDGRAPAGTPVSARLVDLAWVAALAGLLLLFFVLQKAV